MRGSDGFAGSAGFAGPAGSVGSAGVLGLPGFPGLPGSAGVTGVTGVTGRPGARPDPGAGVVPRAGRGDERLAPRRVEREPRDGEVIGGIARGDVSEVDDSRERAGVRDEVAGMQVAVDPDRRPSPLRSGQAGTPHVADHRGGCCVQRLRFAQRCEAVGDGRVAGGQRHAAEGVDGVIGGGCGMKRPQRVRERPCPCGAGHDGHIQGALALDPRHHRPPPGVSGRRDSGDDGRGHPHADVRESFGDAGKHRLLVQNERSSDGSAGESDGMLIAQSPHLAVPSLSDLLERESGRAGELRSRLRREQIADEAGVDRDLGGGLVGHRLKIPCCVYVGMCCIMWESNGGCPTCTQRSATSRSSSCCPSTAG
jgi:hypothetical protein